MSDDFGFYRRLTVYQEILVGDSILQCWDQSTKGLDSGSVANFIKTLRRITAEQQTAAVLSLYQVPEELYAASHRFTS